MANRPKPEINITMDLARTLLNDQFPALEHLELQELSRGWDNTNFRLGETSIIRIPHRRFAAKLVEREHRWLPSLSERIDVAIPSPTHTGHPTDFYPWHWSVTPYFSGSEAASAIDLDQAKAATTLSNFFRQLHTQAPSDAPQSDFRGCPLIDRAESFATHLAQIDRFAHEDQIRAIFESACCAEQAQENVWLHGDLHTRNIIVSRGDLAAIIDWGDICSGDPATDLASAFMLVPDQLKKVRNQTEVNDATWERARGWAANFAVLYLANSDDDPVMARIGTQLVATLLAN